MAVVDVVKSWEGSSATASKELDFETPGEQDFVRVYTATVDDPANDDADTVKADPRVPQIGDQKGTSFKWVTNVQANQSSPSFYEVVVSYTSLDFDPRDPDADPLAAPAKVKWKTVKATGDIDEDADGNPLVTPVGEPVRGVTRPFSDIAAVITQSFASFNPFTFYDFIDKTNDATYLGWPKGTGKVENIDSDPQELVLDDVEITYYNVTVEIVFRNPIRATSTDKAWYNRRMLKGQKHKDVFGNIVYARTDGGDLESAPVPLTATGERIPNPVNPALIIWVEDKIFAEADFNAMGFNFS